MDQPRVDRSSGGISRHLENHPDFILRDAEGLRCQLDAGIHIEADSLPMRFVQVGFQKKLKSIDDLEPNVLNELNQRFSKVSNDELET